MEEKVIDIEEYSKTEIKPKQLIEIEIAKLLGLNILGWADCCDAYEGIICAQEEHGRGDWCLSPVHLGRCDCELFDKNPDHLSFRAVPKFLGHYGSCMEEVPHYARDMDSTMMVIAAIKPDHYLEVVKTTGQPFRVTICEHRPIFEPKTPQKFVCSDESLPMAVCKCFLEYKNGK